MAFTYPEKMKVTATINLPKLTVNFLIRLLILTLYTYFYIDDLFFFLLFQFDSTESGIVDDVHIIGIDTF